jgi:hypothetical protein
MNRQKAIDTAVRHVLSRGWFIPNLTDLALLNLAREIAPAVRAEFHFLVGIR